MNRTYPYTTSQILTEDLYVSYGGATGTSTAFQREVAFVLAEEEISEYIGTPVIPSIITGSYFYPQHGATVQLDWAYLQRIYEVRFRDGSDLNYYTVTGTVGNYDAAIRNWYRSVIDILHIYGNCRGCGRTYAPYRFEIVYEVGLPTGTYTSPRMLLALTKAAEQHLNEIIGYGNESAGLVGVTEFRNQEYMEKRKATPDSVFGSTPTANYIQKLLSSIVKLMKVKL